MRGKDFKYDSIETVYSDLKIVFITDEKTAVTGKTNVHMHSFWEVFCLLEGKLTVTSENEHFELEEGDLLIIPPNLYHSSFSEEGVVKRSVFFTFDKVKEKAYEEPLFAKINAAFSGGFRFVKNDTYAVGLLSKILEGYAEDAVGRLYRIRASVAEFVFHLYDAIEASNVMVPEEGMTQNSYWVYKYAIDRLLDIYYMTDISLDALAQKLFVSSKTVARIISSAYGKSFNELKLELKMRNAKKLLRETDLTVAVIAERSGYTTQRGFLAAFAKYQGMTPGEYRKSKREEENKK